MKKFKLRYLVLIAYLTLVLSVIAFSVTLSRYVSKTNTEANFNVGENLYFHYQRSSLFRNDKLIVGVPVTDEVTGEKRIETMNVAPGDNIVFHFYISNYEEISVTDVNGATTTIVSNKNDVDAVFHPTAKALLSLPVKGIKHDGECTFMYREVPTDGSQATNQFTVVADDLKLDLGAVTTNDDGTIGNKIKYEFQVSVLIEGQIENTTHEDYFDAILAIELFLNAVSVN